MIKVGITGGIGSGKSTVCNIFRILGVPVFNADSEAKRLINSSKEIISELKSRFGEDIYDVDGRINKIKLSNFIFNNKEEMQFTNKLIHPFVVKEFEIWCEQNRYSDYIIHEAAILFESGIYAIMDKIIWVFAPENIRVARVVLRDDISYDSVIQRINTQWDYERVKDSVDYLINNDGEALVIPQVLEIHNILKS